VLCFLLSGNCDIVLVKTPQLLHAAFAIGFIASFMMLFFSCITCGSTCCPTKCCGPADGVEGTDNKDPMGSQEVQSAIHSQQQHVHSQPIQVVVAEEIHNPNSPKNNYV
jgi:hypothetical protein